MFRRKNADITPKVTLYQFWVIIIKLQSPTCFLFGGNYKVRKSLTATKKKLKENFIVKATKYSFLKKFSRKIFLLRLFFTQESISDD